MPTKRSPSRRIGGPRRAPDRGRMRADADAQAGDLTALFAELPREAVEFARAYHDASAAARQRVRQLFGVRDPQEPTGPVSPDAAAIAARIARLTPAQQQLVDRIILAFMPRD